MNDTTNRMHTLASPGLFWVSPALEAIGRIEPVRGEVSPKGRLDSVSTTVRTRDGKTAEVSPLRVGFVSRFFGDEVRCYLPVLVIY